MLADCEEKPRACPSRSLRASDAGYDTPPATMEILAEPGSLKADVANRDCFPAKVID